MTFRAAIIMFPGQDTGNIEVTFYADSVSAAEIYVERLLTQLGLKGNAVMACIAND
jgi:hypothetical protein